MKFKMVDLFAGAGGFSEGFRRVCDGIGVELDLTAINHWPTAVETHSKNHPSARHFCESVYEVNPRDVAPDGYLDCLCASPECIYHSNARGGGVCDDQSRSGAKDILRWVSEINVPTVVIENVCEFVDWGPLYRRATVYKGVRYEANTPIPHKKGKLFREFCAGLRSLGYVVDYGALNSADYGAYTARSRMFMIAHKGNGRVLFPKITHAKEPDHPVLRRWHSAREIIDWNLKGDSLFLRQQGLLPKKKPLVKNTIDRIAWGLQNISRIDPEPYLVMLYGTGKARDIDRPLPTVTATANNIALAEPYFAVLRGQSRAAGPDVPLPTITAGPGNLNLREPYLVHSNYSASGPRRVEHLGKPLPTLTTKSTLGMCEPFLVKYFGSGANAVSSDLPLPTVTTKDRFGLIQPMLFDIRYRLLEPHELAAGMGFDDYVFSGTKTDVKKQIGNAVEVNQATALAYSVLEAWLEAA